MRSCVSPRAAVLVFALLFTATGCEELRARYTIQEADELYLRSKYRKAAKLYEEALAMASVPIGHHNAGLAYFRSFVPGDTTEENKLYGEKAAEHLQAYLTAQPDDRKIRLFLSRIWVDSGKHDKAIAFWESELKDDPKNLEVLTTLSEINRQAGNYPKSLEWMGKRVDAEPTKEGKIQALLAIARIQFSRLRRDDLIDYERLFVADTGLAALKRAEAMDPAHKDVHGHMASLYLLRGFAHGSYWAFAAEQTTQRHHFSIISALNKTGKVPTLEELQKEEPKKAAPKAEEAKAEEPKAEEAKAEEPKAEEAKAEEPEAEEQLEEGEE